MPKAYSVKAGRTIVFNAACNWLSFALHIVIVFFLTPFIISRIGPTGYGIWALANGLTGYYGLVDFGLRAGLTQLVTHMVADRKQSQLAATVSGAWFALATLALAILIVVVPIVAYLGPGWFRLDESWVYQFRWSVVVLGFVFCVQLVLFPYGTVLPALQRYDLSALITVVTRLLSLIANLVVLTWWPTLMALSIVFAGVTICEYVIRAVVAKWLLPEFRFTMRWNANTIRTTLSYTLWNAIITLAGRIQLYTGLIVLGLVKNPLDVAVFAIASRLVEYLGKNTDSVTRVMFPSMSHAAVQMPRAQLASLVCACTRVITLALACIAVGGYLLGSDFLQLWLGDEIQNKGLDLANMASVLHVLLVGMAVTAPRLVTIQFLLAVKYLRALALLTLTEAVVHVLLALVLAYAMGAVGVAYSAVVPGLVVGVWVQQFYVLKHLNMSVGLWFNNVWLPTMAVCAVLIPVTYALASVKTVHGWGDFVIYGSVFAAIAASMVWVLGLRPQDRQFVLHLVSGAAGKLLKLRRRSPVLTPRQTKGASEQKTAIEEERKPIVSVSDNLL